MTGENICANFQGVEAVSLAAAVASRRWELVALCLLLGWLEASAQRPARASPRR